MTPLYSLRGAENLPKKVSLSNPNWIDPEVDAFNEAITQTEKCGLVVDEKILTKILLWGEYKRFPGDPYSDAMSLTKSLSATMKEWLIICKE